MAITTTSVLSPQVQLAMDKVLLSTPTDAYIHRMGASMRDLPQHHGSKLRMTRYYRLPTALVPLGNTGVTPPAVPLTAVNIDAEITYHGMYTEINDQVILQVSDPVLNSAALRLGDSLRQTEDELTRNMLAATASVYLCAGGTNGDIPTEITRSDINRVASILRGNKAEYFTNIIQGSNKFGSAPVRRAFIAMCHTDIQEDLDAVTGYTDLSQYPSQQDIKPAEIGAVAALRFFASSFGSITPNASLTGANIYNVFCQGKDAVGTVEQSGYKKRLIHHSPIDPLEQNTTMGYKFTTATALLNDEHIMNMRCTRST